MAIASYILQTPLDIYEVTKLHFPQAQASIIVEPSSIKMEILLTERIKRLVIDTAIDKAAFCQDLQFYKRFEYISEPMDEITLNSSRFTIPDTKLLNWEKFRRAMFKKAGNKCSASLINYLQAPTPENEAVLVHLGLAPDQMREGLTSSGYKHLKKLVNTQLPQLQTSNRELYISTRDELKTRYPLAYNKFVKELDGQPEPPSPEDERYQRQYQYLQGRVIGQDETAKKLADVLSKQVHLDENKAFLFVGPSGVGKTEMAKAVANLRDPNALRSRLVRFNMNQYVDENKITAFWGSATHLRGSTDKPIFAKELDPFVTSRQPIGRDKIRCIVQNIVLLFDEFEKASSQIKQSLLTLIEEGVAEITYVHSEVDLSTKAREDKNLTLTYIFKKCLVIGTSNLFQTEILRAFEQKKAIDEISDQFKELNRDKIQMVGGYGEKLNFSPELMARMTVTPFGPIPQGEPYQKVIKMKLRDFISKLKIQFTYREIQVEQEEKIAAAIEKKIYRQGVDLRRITEYLDGINQVIREKVKGDSRTKKLVLTYDERLGICLEISRFHQVLEEYGEPWYIAIDQSFLE